MYKLIVSIFIFSLPFFCLPNSVVAAAGDLDSTYGVGGKVTNDFFGFDDDILAAAIQPDGKTVVVGIIQVELNLYRFTIARYKLDGSLDPAFGSSGKVLLTGVGLATVALQPDGKIIVAGTIQRDFGLLRFNNDGSPDAAFGTNGVATVDFFSDPQKVDNVLGLALQPDGRIVAAGYANSGEWLAVARLNANGSLDTTFGNGGKVTPGMGPGFEQASVVKIQPDSKIVVAGRVDRSANFSTSDFGLARFSPNGQLDDTFGTGGRVITTIGSGQSTCDVRDLVIQADGKILVAGVADFKFALMRYDSEGSLDTGFGSAGKVLGPGGAAIAVVIQCDGRIVAADSSTFTDSDFRVVRYNLDGTMDNSFGNQGIVSTDFGGSDHINALALQPDCKILSAGVNRRFGHYDDFASARYLTTQTNAPVLQAVASSNRAIALDSVTFIAEPFSVTNEHNFSSDRQTRIILLATNLTLSSGESISAVSVQAETAGGAIHALPVEYVGEVPGFEWLTQLVVRLPGEVANAGTVQVKITHGNTSNKASLTIN